MSPKSPTIALCGDGHGAIAAFESLSDTYPALEVVTSDPQLAERLREADRNVCSIDKLHAQLVVLAGYGKLILADQLNERTFINTHPSKLPQYRGMHSVVWAMLNGESEIGFSIHLVNDEMDDGDILEQFIVENRGQTSAEIWEEFDEYVRENLARVVKGFIKGTISPKRQDRSLATWVPRRNVDDCIIDFSEPNWRIEALFKALVAPYPLPRIRVGDHVYEVVKAEVWDRDYYATIGRVVAHYRGSALIKTSEGILCVKLIRKVGANGEIPATDILAIGKRL